MGVLFWACVGLMLYTYLLYPLLIIVWARLFRRHTPAGELDLPTVSMVIAAYNEEDVIGKKLRNCLALDYPAERIEFLLGSDGSTDQTNEILSDCVDARIRAFLYQERAGKLNVLNKIVPAARGDILVFSDANTMYESDAVQKLVRHFEDLTVGGVCGRLILMNPNDSDGGRGEGLYWRYENVLKRAEGLIYTVIGANGAIYAIRRELFRPLPARAVVMDDFLIPLRVLEQGQRVVYDPDARAIESTSPDMHGEFTRKVRIAAANFNAIPHILGLLNPLRGFVALALWSHKMVRWSVPFLAIGALVTNALLLDVDRVYVVTLSLQLIAYVGAIIGYLGDRLFHRSGLFLPFYYLVTMNLAVLLGFWRSVTRTQEVAWERVQH
jgi:cellulose synthase/poly-beta-1,6-N-acetylglucosamine synthase-like glycosyltransferase